MNREEKNVKIGNARMSILLQKIDSVNCNKQSPYNGVLYTCQNVGRVRCVKHVKTSDAFYVIYHKNEAGNINTNSLQS